MVSQDIKECLRENYLPYAVSVITDRALPSIDGLKPSHRKLLYTMYKMGLLKGSRTKSANIVGQTMKLNPHGDASIYETMVRLTKNNESLLTPLVDSKGNFGKIYSRDMAYAAARYTEAKLMPIAEELFKGIDSNIVDMIDNYDGTTKEPILLPTTFPFIISNANMGIAVSMASNICSFNLSEICDYTIDTLNGCCDYNLIPDFSTGGELLLEDDVITDINDNGRGSIKIRAKYKYDKENSCIDIYEIPYTTTCEAIVDKIVDLFKDGKVKEITDVRDETDLSGLKITIDIKKNVNPDTLMQKLFKITPLQDSFGCNFNILINNRPQVLGVKSIIEEWIKFRKQCLRRELLFDIDKLSEEENELLGLKIVILDIDKAITIIRNSKSEKEAIANLMSQMSLNEKQAEYVADIKLRNLNQAYLTKKIERLGLLQESLFQMRDNVNDEKYYTNVIINQLTEIKAKYGQPRKTGIVYENEVETILNDVLVEDYNCTVVFSHDYVKKNIRYLDKQRMKDGDSLLTTIQCNNKDKLIAITDKGQVFTINVNDIQQCMPSDLGQFQSTIFNLQDERIVNVFKYEEGKSITLITQEGKCLVLDHSLLLGRKKQVISLGKKFDDNKVIYAEEYTPTVTIEDNKNTKEYEVTYDYYSGKPNNGGNFILNCRNGKKKIISINKYFKID